ncbi:MAG TPA: hypothetical protein VG963_05665, partial [Polyangiaceae bacterium]|nr:hypothetical protein [Polyangiaceae bacterium]
MAAIETGGRLRSGRCAPAAAEQEGTAERFASRSTRRFCSALGAASVWLLPALVAAQTPEDPTAPAPA